MPDINLFWKDRLGARVQRAAANLPQTAAAAIFNITGGRVILTGIIGEVTTVLGATATNLKLTANPTAASVASVDLCAVVAVANDPVGTLYGITGTFATALQKGGAVSLPALPITLFTGTIDLDASGSNTGQVKWTAYYMPLDTGAKLVAA